jgi:hypothetical protein
LIAGALFAGVTVFLYISSLIPGGGGHGALPADVLLFLILISPTTWLTNTLHLPMAGSIKELSIAFIAAAAGLNATIGASAAYILTAAFQKLRRRRS